MELIGTDVGSVIAKFAEAFRGWTPLPTIPFPLRRDHVRLENVAAILHRDSHLRQHPLETLETLIFAENIILTRDS